MDSEHLSTTMITNFGAEVLILFYQDICSSVDTELLSNKGGGDIPIKILVNYNGNKPCWKNLVGEGQVYEW